MQQDNFINVFLAVRLQSHGNIRTAHMT